jgi:hypothetical protein
MSKSEGKSISIERILIIVLAVLLLIALLYIAFTMGRRSAPATGMDEPVVEEPSGAELPPADGGDSAELPADEPSEEQPAPPVVEAEPTSSVQRLTLEPTPTPFALANEDDPRHILDLANPDHLDYFNNPDAWYDYETEGFAGYRVEDGHLYGVDFDALNRGVYWSYTYVQSGNVYAEISTTNGDCAARDAVGLTIRLDPDETPSGYAFEVSCDGAWRLLRYRPAGGPTATQVDWTASNAINQGPFATNRLGIWGYYGKFYLFVNGIQVGDHFDPSPPWSYGFFAAYVRSQISYPLSATFDDFAFWHIPFIP